MKRQPIIFSLFVGAGIIGAAVLVHAQAGPVGPPAPIEPGLGFTEMYKQLRAIWLFALFPSVQAFFFKLATLEIALSAILWMAAQQALDTLAAHFFKKILWIGFSYALLLHADEWIPAIIDSFKAAGEQASGLTTLDPSTVFLQGLGLAVQMLWAMGIVGVVKHPIGVVIGILAALGVIISFGFIAIEMAVTIVESYIVTGAGVLLLGFSVFRGTAAITERYLAYVVGVGLKFFMIYLIVGAGTVLAPAWGAFINAASMFEFTVPLTIAFSSLLYFLLATRIPALAASLATGTTSLGFADVVGTAIGAIRVAAIASAAGSVAAGTLAVGQAAARTAGGGWRGAVRGTWTAGSALSREAAEATVPRLHYIGSNLQRQGESIRNQQQTSKPENLG